MSALIWGDWAINLADQLNRQGILTDADEPHTVESADWAIQSAVESFNGREGARIEHLDEKIWWYLADDLCGALGVDFDCVWEPIA